MKSGNASFAERLEKLESLTKVVVRSLKETEMENKLDNFLVKVDKIVQDAKNEISTQDNTMLVTALHGKYLGPKGELSGALKGFSATNDTEQDLSKHAVDNAKTEVKDLCLKRITDIARQSC